MALRAVIFDLDGVLVDSEQVWDATREALTVETGGSWGPDAQRAMMGMSSVEWSTYMHDELGVPLEPERISEDVARRVVERYRSEGVPLMPGAVGCVERLAARWPLAIASSSNRPVIDLVLELAGLDRLFQASVSSEEVARGKPAPDVYLAAAQAVGEAPSACAAIEDSTTGIWSAKNARMRVIAVPNPTYPPAADAIAAADSVLRSLEDLEPADVVPHASGDTPKRTAETRRGEVRGSS